MLIKYFFSLLAVIAISYVAEKSANREEINLYKVLRKSFSRWGSAIGTDLWMWLKLVGLTLLLVIPGVIFFVYYLFVTNVVALRNKGGREAMEYSENLVRGNWWKVAGIFLFLSVTLMFSVFLVTRFLSNLLPEKALLIISPVAIDMLRSFYYLAGAIFFLNLDYRKMAVTGERQTPHPVAFNRVNTEGILR